MKPGRRRWLVPEVIQTSAMDCGPAVLACLLQGHGVPADYGRLREVCQTEVDGTSIDVLEAVACQAGLHAEQVMLPGDHLLLPESEALPAIVVTVLPTGLTHFVLLWRRHGPFVQVMDPGQGRRWLTCSGFLGELYQHSHRLPAATWRAWAGSDGFGGPLTRRLRELGLGRAAVESRLAGARQDEGWRSLGRLDAATRLIAALVRGGGVRRGREAAAILDGLLTNPPESGDELIPQEFWSVRPAPPLPESAEEEVFLCGAVLVRVTGKPAEQQEERPPPALAAALQEAPSPRQHVRRLLGPIGVGVAALLVMALCGLALGVVVEGLILRGAIDVGRDLSLRAQRLAALGGLLVMALLLLGAEWLLADLLLRLGRRLETALRLEFLAKLPRMPTRYFNSRPVSDLAERCHSLHQIRRLPALLGRFSLTALTLATTAGAIAWFHPGAALLAFAGAVLALLVPLLGSPALSALDLRLRTHAGGLTRFYLDALLGLIAIRAHGAEATVRREFESLLTDWAAAAGQLLRTALVIEGAQLVLAASLAGLVLVLRAGEAEQSARALLLAFWVLNLPLLGQDLVILVRQYPLQRNVTLRLLEPLGAAEEPDVPASETSPPRLTTTSGAAVELRGVSAAAGGRFILEELSLSIAPGSHVAIVGPSGSGKSSLVGLLLGRHAPAVGDVLVDGLPLHGENLQRLRERTAWVDPGVRLWNQSLLDNLLYGGSEAADLGEVLPAADLLAVLQRLPQGLQTPLGEGGGLVSGGEGQRVRLGRGLARAGARLVILDEPFRGLDRPLRHELLTRARRRWQSATLLCVTHDLEETAAFERVLVVEGGRVVEDDSPANLLSRPDSRYRLLLETEGEVRDRLWNNPLWRRCVLADGKVREGGP